jgi:hypothetical protein
MLNWIRLEMYLEISSFVFQKYICTVQTFKVPMQRLKTTRQETIASKEQACKPKSKHHQRQATQIKKPREANNMPRTKPHFNPP